jgi:hypothetical protein
VSTTKFQLIKNATYSVESQLIGNMRTKPSTFPCLVMSKPSCTCTNMRNQNTLRMHHIVLLDLNMRKSNTQMLPMKYHACCPMKPNEFKVLLVTEITQPCVHTCNGLFICQLYSLPNLLEETDCKEDMPLMLPFCIIHFLLTVDNSDMN